MNKNRPISNQETSSCNFITLVIQKRHFRVKKNHVSFKASAIREGSDILIAISEARTSWNNASKLRETIFRLEFHTQPSYRLNMRQGRKNSHQSSQNLAHLNSFSGNQQRIWSRLHQENTSQDPRHRESNTRGKRTRQQLCSSWSTQATWITVSGKPLVVKFPRPTVKKSILVRMSLNGPREDLYNRVRV